MVAICARVEASKAVSRAAIRSVDPATAVATRPVRGAAARVISGWGIVVLGGLLGLSVVLWPAPTALTVAVSLALAALAGRGSDAPWNVFVGGMAGVLVLGYGFANLGVTFTPVPIPLAEIVLMILLAGAYLAGPVRPRLPAPLVVALLYVGLASLRLAIDLPRWGQLAVRDFTLPLETGFLFVGYYLTFANGVERWVRSFRWVFLVCLGYFWLYPFAETLAGIGPLVGLQRPVPLLGSYAGVGTATLAGSLFYTLLRPLGGFSYAVAGAFLPLLLLFQARGLYLALPLAVLILALGARSNRRDRLRSAVIGALLVGAVGGASLLALRPEGRMGEVSPRFFIEHVATLLGAEGPGAGSFHHRLQWYEEVASTIAASPVTLLFGVGLGPDLAGGFRIGDEVAVRKPHNDYLEVLARQGIVGFTLFAGMLGWALFRIVTAARASAGPDARFLWWVASSAAIFLLIAATQPLLAFPYGTMPLFSLLGAGLAVCELSRARSVEPRQIRALRTASGVA